MKAFVLALLLGSYTWWLGPLGMASIDLGYDCPLQGMINPVDNPECFDWLYYPGPWR